MRRIRGHDDTKSRLRTIGESSDPRDWAPDERRGVRVEGERYRVVGARRGREPVHEIAIWLGALKQRTLRLLDFSPISRLGRPTSSGQSPQSLWLFRRRRGEQAARAKQVASASHAGIGRPLP